MARDWTRAEVDLLVEDYFRMLREELEGRPYSKAEHRRALLRSLRNRSNSSIEFKHRNVSAVLLELNCPFISGYKPAANAQGLLREAVQEQLRARAEMQDLFQADALRTLSEPPSVEDILLILEAPPDKDSSRPRPRWTATSLHPSPFDYFAMEAENRSLGFAGELMVCRYEQALLVRGGRDSLAERVEHVAVTQGDGLGYDVRSFEVDGSDRFIEVKTTRYGKETPFFLTRNEYEVSRELGRRYHLHRLFRFRRSPGMYSLQGDLSRHCRLDPAVFRARPTVEPGERSAGVRIG